MRPVMAEERVGLVLAGGGARGAYEVGALSVLLPALEARGERPTVLVGASVGGMNVAYLAANADLSADEVVAGGVALWRALRWDQVLGPLWHRRPCSARFATRPTPWACLGQCSRGCSTPGRWEGP